MTLPELFLTRMEQLLEGEFPAFAASYDEAPAAGLKINTLKISPDEFEHLSPFEIKKLPFGNSSFKVDPSSQPGKHPYHAAGLYYLQEPSAVAVSELASPYPGEIVLDLAAAPGGKATQFASALDGEGLLLANEIHPRRVWELVENLERWGARNAVISQEKPEILADHFGAWFDRVLLDAPCSGEGMFRKSPASLQEWSPSLVQSCAVRQSAILEEAARFVRPGGLLVYSTCTFSPEENERVVEAFLRSHPDFSIETPPELPGASPGRPDWVLGTPSPDLAKAVRFWPHTSPTEGHFAALIRRHDGPQTHSPPRLVTKPLPSEAWTLFKRFVQESLQQAWLSRFQMQRHQLMVTGTNRSAQALYLIPDHMPDPGSLKLIRPGWWLGMLRKGRFEPSHSLALGLQKKDALMTVDYAAISSEISTYLRGETLHLPGPDGWMLICVDGSPLGWGKRTRGMTSEGMAPGGVIKNFYPRGLRWT